ncbi:hypothetical protein RFI_30387 [Reticulomyxa filosa]|uniref:Uncharacterized protein n=1 Tax=Reticulomyxa filosa TaxID=46433 RepID=X6M080_RETFI|nr:hypothetical protein RFI_30387 [Reticulomyxa filosa]|eukprot:ETO07006.1 hypothetical protein RFI_30387 [Reticulomyxa filosa]
MISANPQLAISQWITKLVKKVVEMKQGHDIHNSWFSIGTNGTTRKYEASELKLKWSKTVLSHHLEVLDGLVSNGHHHLIPYMSLLGAVITLISGAMSPEIQDFGGRLFESVAASLMQDRPSEVHQFSTALWNRAIDGTGDNEDQTTKWKHWMLGAFGPNLVLLNVESLPWRTRHDICQKNLYYCHNKSSILFAFLNLLKHYLKKIEKKFGSVIVKN